MITARCIFLLVLVMLTVRAWGERKERLPTFERPEPVVHLHLADGPADADLTTPSSSFERELADALSDYECWIPCLTTAALLAADNRSERRIGELAAWSVLYTSAATYLLKATIESPRPNRPEVKNGFPSGHTSMTFAFARSVAEEDSTWGTIAYAWATGVAWSRVRRGDHDIPQVLAGAVMGWWIADQVVRDRRPTTSSDVAVETPLQARETPVLQGGTRPRLEFAVAW